MHGLLADVRRGVLEGLHERLEDRRVTQLHERVHCGFPHFLVGVLERCRQRRDHTGVRGRALSFLRAEADGACTLERSLNCALDDALDDALPGRLDVGLDDALPRALDSTLNRCLCASAGFLRDRVSDRLRDLRHPLRCRSGAVASAWDVAEASVPPQPSPEIGTQARPPPR